MERISVIDSKGLIMSYLFNQYTRVELKAVDFLTTKLNGRPNHDKM